MAEKPVPDWPDVMSQSGRKTWPCWPDPLAICNQDYWIYSCPAAVLAFAFFCAAANIRDIIAIDTVRHTVLLLSAAFIITEVSHAGKIDGLGGHYKTYDYDMLGMKQIEEINKTVDFNGRNHKTLKLYAGWKLQAPVR